MNVLEGAAEQNSLPIGDTCMGKLLTAVSENEGEVRFDEIPSNIGKGRVDGSTGRTYPKW